MENKPKKSIKERIENEKKISMEIDRGIYSIGQEMEYITNDEYIKILEKIRLYRERIFFLKSQINDFNKMYDKIEGIEFYR